MKKLPYMSKDELINWLKVGVLAGEAARIAALTPDKSWKQKLKTIATYAENITNERLKLLDKNQTISVARRRNHTKMLMLTTDEDRMFKLPTAFVKIEEEDYLDILELAFCSCQSCEQGMCVRDCKYRKILHKLGAPVARNDVNKMQCEFRTNDIQILIRPHDFELQKENVL